MLPPVIEAGIITGDLTLRTDWDGRQALLTVQYDGADEWYTVDGSPVPAPTAAEAADLGKLTPQGWDEVYGVTFATRALPAARLAHLTPRHPVDPAVLPEAGPQTARTKGRSCEPSPGPEVAGRRGSDRQGLWITVR
ncbi:hypothetical protein ACIQ9P_39165 [Kitasatospora sp. NPDC094019]|uniref:hypothetical protein n=1 Tax=Kitasatospora sp. NPDC094019 TaxID=3364091 RepID=UPI0038071553